jgi:hypothetical protein
MLKNLPFGKIVRGFWQPSVKFVTAGTGFYNFLLIPQQVLTTFVMSPICQEVFAR